MRKFLTYLVTLVIGIIIGGAIMGYLSMKASRIYIETFRINFEQEQELLAAHARKNGLLHWELGYRKNVVDLYPPNKLGVFEKFQDTWEFGFPFAAPILERIGDIPDRERVFEVNKGHKVALLANTLERLGMKDEAAQKWKEAAQLMGHNDIEKVKAIIPMWHDIENKWLKIEGDLTNMEKKPTGSNN